MNLRLLKFTPVAALAFLGLSLNATPAAAGGCGYSGCEAVRPVPVVVYQSGCGCGGGSYYYSYAPASTYPSAYYGYAAYPAYGYGYAYGTSVARYRYINRSWGPRVYVGARRWVR